MYTKATERTGSPRYVKNVRATNSLAASQRKIKWRNCKDVQPHSRRFDEYPHNRLLK